ncbi:hypothetical protein [Nostocoides vanveenii]|uniref:MmcQ/YjbR family DNA-binding protein n=1 Tax=Nostocoides vanveenii TaxID=330835 RepID=A0ABP4WMB3_9MICO
MATTEDLDRIARSFDGVSVGTYWADPHAFLLPGRGGTGFVMKRSPRRQEGTVDPATDEPYADLIVVALGTAAAHDEALAMFPPDVVFTIPHFAGHSGVLAHLDRISVEQLEDLLDLCWRSKQA